MLSAAATAMLLTTATLSATVATASAQSASAPAAGSFSIRPVPDQDVNSPKNPAREHTQTSLSWFTFHGQAGQQIQDAVRLVNTGPVAVDILLYPVDATTGVTSGLVMQNRDAERAGVSTWTTLSSDKVHLNPSESKDVPFTVAVPAALGAGEHWGGLMAEDTNVRRGTGQFAVDQVMRTGVALGVTLEGARVQKLAITGISEKVVNNLNEVFVINLANQGNVMVKPQGLFELKDAAGKVVASQELKLDNILAGSAIPYEFFWSKDPIPAGKYSASVTLSTGGETAPVTFSDQAVDVQSPGAKLVAGPQTSSNQPGALQVVPVGSSAQNPAPATSSSPLQSLIPGFAGGAVVLLALGAYQLGRRRRG
jgi:hypothetical protein